jgi:hypothetical protein
MSRSLRACWRLLSSLLRFGFLLLLFIVPVPVGALFHKALERSRRTPAAKVVQRENPD